MKNFPHLAGMKIGSQVIFGRPNGEQTKGEVIKINRKSVKVKTTEVRYGNGRTRSVGAVWTVHPSLLIMKGESSYTPLTQTPPPAFEVAYTKTSVTVTPRYRLGDKVSFRSSNGEIQEGFVKRVSKKTVSVEPHKGADRYWRVPHSLFI